MPIGEIIKMIRKQQKINIGEMAKKIGISAATLSRIENHKDLSVSTYKKVHKFIFGW